MKDFSLWDTAWRDFDPPGPGYGPASPVVARTAPANNLATSSLVLSSICLFTLQCSVQNKYYHLEIGRRCPKEL